MFTVLTLVWIKLQTKTLASGFLQLIAETAVT